jgi:hypothetical protein
VVLTTHPLLAPGSRKDRAIPLTSGPVQACNGTAYFTTLCSLHIWEPTFSTNLLPSSTVYYAVSHRSCNMRICRRDKPISHAGLTSRLQVTWSGTGCHISRHWCVGVDWYQPSDVAWCVCLSVIHSTDTKYGVNDLGRESRAVMRVCIWCSFPYLRSVLLYAFLDVISTSVCL